MARKAEDIYKIAKQNQKKLSESSYASLKEKAVQAVTEMMKSGQLVTEIDLVDSDMSGLIEFTQEIRSLNYYYCLIETQNEAGDILGHRLRISLKHLENQNGQQDLPQVSLEN